MLTLTALLLLCHFAADYTHLSTPWMLSAKRFGTPVTPIIAHAGVHALLMFLVVLFGYGVHAALLVGVFQFVSHALIDTTKGRINATFPAVQSSANPAHWYVFGIDQTLHILVILFSVHLVYTPA